MKKLIDLNARFMSWSAEEFTIGGSIEWVEVNNIGFLIL